jgi:hypothetical protein
MSTQNTDVDPFEQAANAEEADRGKGAQTSSMPDPVLVEPIDDALDATLEVKDTNQPDRESLPQASTAQPRSGFTVAGLVASVALVLSMGIAAGVVYALNQTGQLRADTNVALTDVDDNIAALGNRQSESEVSISQLRETAGQNTIRIRQLDTDRLAEELALIKRDVDQFKSSLSNSKVDSEENMQALLQRVSDLESVTQSLQQSSASRNSSPEPKRVVRAPKPQPRVFDTLEGNTVVSVDQWGYDSSVVLHDPVTDELVSVAKGGVVKGWRYEGANAKAETATFVRGGKTINVRIKG